MAEPPNFHQPPSASSSPMTGWEHHYQPHHHGHYHQNYYNPYLGFYNQPQGHQPQVTSSNGPLIKSQESESEQQATISEPSKSPQPQIGGYEQSDLSRFNPAEAAAAAAALQAASIAAASYEMYPGQQQTQQPSIKTSTPMGGANSPTSFYPWMKNFNGKALLKVDSSDIQPILIEFFIDFIRFLGDF